MAIVNGTNYSFIDMQQASGGNTTRHMLKDTQARQDVSDLKSALDDFANTQILHRQYALVTGGINLSGQEISSTTQMRTPEYFRTDDATGLSFLLDHTASKAVYISYYNASQVFQVRVAADIGTEINSTDYTYFRLSFYMDTGINESTFRTWISWIESDATNARFEQVERQLAGKIKQVGGNVYIDMGKASYQIQHVVNVGININTWRLYRGVINGNSPLTMWENSDAEGVVRLVDEADYIGGFHGDEQYQSAVLFVDGIEHNLANALSTTQFKCVDLFVYSKVYHANTVTPTDSALAFYRYKHLHFAGDTVIIAKC